MADIPIYRTYHAGDTDTIETSQYAILSNLGTVYVKVKANVDYSTGTFKIGPLYIYYENNGNSLTGKLTRIITPTAANQWSHDWSVNKQEGDSVIFYNTGGRESQYGVYWGINNINMSNKYTDESVHPRCRFFVAGNIVGQSAAFNIDIDLDLTIYGSKPIHNYTVSYKNDDGSAISGGGTYREGTPLKTLTTATSKKTPDSKEVDHPYTLKYNPNGGYETFPDRNLKGKDRVKYKNVFGYWLESSGKSYGGGEDFTVEKNMVFTAQYDTVQDGAPIPISYPKIQSNYLQQVTRKGYVPNKEWRYSETGVKVEVNDEITANPTWIYIDWNGKERNYDVKYNKNTNDRTYRVEDGKTLPDKLSGGKYYTKDAKLTDVNLLRTGWKFDGWYNDQLNKELGVDYVYSVKTGPWSYSFNNQTQRFEMNGIGDSINYNKFTGLTRISRDAFNDTYYDKLATNAPNSNPSITLYAVWSLNENAIRGYFFDRADHSTAVQRNVDLFYNIKGYKTNSSESSTTFEYGAPVGYETLRDNPDYVFLGWIKSSDMTPEEISYWINTSHGVYRHPDELKEDIQWVAAGNTPSNIIIDNLNKITDWGETSIYFGFWIGTGKYIKIDDSWKKINEIFFKDDNKWKSVKEMFVKIDGNWKREVIYK